MPEGKGKFVAKLGRGELVYEGELMQVSAPGVCDDVRALVQGRRCRGPLRGDRRAACASDVEHRPGSSAVALRARATPAPSARCLAGLMWRRKTADGWARFGGRASHGALGV